MSSGGREVETELEPYPRNTSTSANLIISVVMSKMSGRKDDGSLVNLPCMRILPPVEEKIRRTIRDAQARDPLINVSGVQKELQRKMHRTFDRTYRKRLCEKVARESRIEVDRAQIEDRMNFTRENYRMMREECVSRSDRGHRSAPRFGHIRPRCVFGRRALWGMDETRMGGALFLTLRHGR